MRILSVADLHYTLKQFDWIRQVADSFDLLIIPGDLLDIVSVVDLDTQILVIRKYLRELPKKVPVLVASGNHDGDARNDANESVAYWLQDAKDLGCHVDGDSYEQDGILFTMCPWWDGDVTREELEDLLEKESKKDCDRWVWIYHAPPSGSPLAWDGKREFGDEFLGGWIEKYQPDLVLGGHIHQAPFVHDGAWHDRLGKTLVINAGKQIGPIPALCEIDTNENQITWRSLAGVETIELWPNGPE